MKKSEKVFEVENLKAKIKEAKSVAAVDYKGITVAQVTQLREKIKSVGGELQVAKNSLFLRALRDMGIKKIDEKLFTGPSLFLFSNSDEVTPLKQLVTFGKQANLLPLKMGLIGQTIFTGDDLNKIANLPPKIELQAKLVGMMISPLNRLVYGLNYNLQKFVIVLNEVKNKKQ